MSDDLERLLGNTGSLKTFVELVHRHEQSEYDQDVAAAMDTVCADPYYTIMPLGWTIRDRGLLRDFYTALVPLFKHMVPVQANRQLFYGTGGLVQWDRSVRLTLEDGSSVSGDILAIVTRDPATGLVSGEHAFIGDELAEAFERALAPELIRKLTAERQGQ